MEENTNKKKVEFKKSDLIIAGVIYLITATYLSSLAFKEGNLAAPDLPHKIFLILISVFVAAPCFTVGFLAVRFRLEHFRKTKDFAEYLVPTKGSLGNPDINELIGSKATRLLKIFYSVLIILLVLVIISFIIWRKLYS